MNDEGEFKKRYFNLVEIAKSMKHELDEKTVAAGFFLWLDEARQDIFSCFEYRERLLLINNSIQHGVERTWTIKDEPQLINALLKWFGNAENIVI